jgi:hypothetical protein
MHGFHLLGSARSFRVFARLVNVNLVTLEIAVFFFFFSVALGFELRASHIAMQALYLLSHSASLRWQI